MEYAALIILVALVQFFWFSARVGIKRGKYGVKAPSTVGDPTWERIYRVQQNTMEQLVVFIPAMLAFSAYVSPIWVILPGLVFIIGRQLYSYEYISNPESRVPGMALSLLSNAVLIAGGVIGLVLKLV